MTPLDQMYDEAIALRMAGNPEAAVAKLMEVIGQNPDFTLAHSALAVTLQKLGRYEDAIRHAVRVTELEPRDSFSFTQLSVICQRCGKIPEAEAAMDQARRVQMGMTS